MSRHLRDVLIHPGYTAVGGTLHLTPRFRYQYPASVPLLWAHPPLTARPDRAWTSMGRARLISWSLDEIVYRLPWHVRWRRPADWSPGWRRPNSDSPLTLTELVAVNPRGLTWRLAGRR